MLRVGLVVDRAIYAQLLQRALDDFDGLEVVAAVSAPVDFPADLDAMDAAVIDQLVRHALDQSVKDSTTLPSQVPMAKFAPAGSRSKSGAAGAAPSYVQAGPSASGCGPQPYVLPYVPTGVRASTDQK
jgi:hypothetical protein